MTVVSPSSYVLRYRLALPLSKQTISFLVGPDRRGRRAEDTHVRDPTPSDSGVALVQTGQTRFGDSAKTSSQPPRHGRGRDSGPVLHGPGQPGGQPRDGDQF
jgi:hypothetical protein